MTATTPRALLFCVALLLPAAAQACPVCFGAPGNQVTGAINMAILLMLVLILFILGCIGVFAYVLAKRARTPLQPHQELTQMMEIESSARR